MNEILMTTLVITVIAAGFALLLSIADRKLNDYGEVKLSINDGNKEMTVEGGATLLNTLVEQKIFIPSACGGKGSCGYCKCKVSSGGGQVLATEKPWLSEDELKDNVRLSCQVKVKEDISISIPEELFNVKEYHTVVEEVKPMTAEISKFRFKLPENETISFKPGQFVQLITKEYDGGKDFEGQDESVMRAYSIASSIKDEKYIELLIGYTKGIATTYAHKIIKEGDEVTITGPFGDFYYTDDDRDEIVMVAAGTGFAPIRSILYHMLDTGIKKKARFYFGAKTQKDLFLLDEMKMFEEKLYDFKFMPTLSREPEDSGWEGDRGRVNNSIDKYLEKDKTYTAYLCGSPVMIEGIVKSLKEKQVDEEFIYFDEF